MAITLKPITNSKAMRHEKKGKPPSLRVIYHCGMSRFSEWICLEHGGFATRKAHHWWRRRFSGSSIPKTVQEALSDMFLSQALAEMTEKISIQRNGKYVEVRQVFLKGEVRAAS